MMDRCVGVLRTKEGLETMLEEIERCYREDLSELMVQDKCRLYNFELRDALEMNLRLIVELLSTRAALMRTESRGSHFRDDYPERNDANWLKNIVFRRENGEIVSEIREVKMPILNISDLPDYASMNSPWH